MKEKEESNRPHQPTVVGYLVNTRNAAINILVETEEILSVMRCLKRRSQIGALDTDEILTWIRREKEQLK